MAKSGYHSRAKLLKEWGLIHFDLRGKLTPAKKSAITKQWNATSTVHGLARNGELKVIRVSKGTQTGNRFRIGNSVFVNRDGADRVTYNKKTGNIVKTTVQRGSIKTVRAPLNPKPENINEVFSGLKDGEALYIRSAQGKGLTSPATRVEDVKAFEVYLQQRIEQIMSQVQRTQGKTETQARKYAKEIIESFYSVKITYTKRSGYRTRKNPEGEE